MLIKRATSQGKIYAGSGFAGDGDDDGDGGDGGGDDGHGVSVLRQHS